MMEDIQKAFEFLQRLDGVVHLKVLNEAEKAILLDSESKGEEKKFMGMCRTYNKAAREALARRHTLVIIIEGGQFKALPFPRMKMMYNDDLVGEELYENEKIETLKKSKDNVFLWDNFAVFMKKLPKDKTERDKLVIVHTPTDIGTSKDPAMFENLVMGEPCIESDQTIKNWMRFEAKEGIFGTILIGFDAIK